MEEGDGSKGTIWQRWSQQISGLTALVVALGGLVSAIERCGPPAGDTASVQDPASASRAANDESGAAETEPGAEQAGDAEAEPAAELVLEAEADPEQGAAPLTVTFTATAEGAAGALAYTWDFGDGSPPSNKARPTHRFTEPGEYTVTVRAKDTDDTEGDAEVLVTVTDE